MWAGRTMLSHEIGRNQILHFSLQNNLGGAGILSEECSRRWINANSTKRPSELRQLPSTGKIWFTLSGRMAPLALPASYPCLQYKAGLQIQGCLSGSAQEWLCGCLRHCRPLRFGRIASRVYMLLWKLRRNFHYFFFASFKRSMAISISSVWYP